VAGDLSYSVGGRLMTLFGFLEEIRIERETEKDQIF
jgi:hypothetical protein